MNIVVVVSGGLAETLQAAPLIRAVGTGPDGPPLLLCAPDGADLVRTIAGVGEVVTMPALGGRRRPGQLWAALRFRRLDVALLCSERGGVRAAVYGAAVPRRVGCRDGLSDVLLTDVVACPPDENRQRAWTRLADPLLGTVAPPEGPLYTPSAELAAVAERHLLETGVGDGRLLVAIVPGHGFAAPGTETWSPERFAHLANRLASRHGAGMVLLGDAGDRAAAERLRIDLAADVVDLCGQLDLATAAAVISRCDLLVSADTPLLHVAAAVGTPSVGLFARTDGRRRGAAGGEHRIVQAVANGTAASLDRIRVDDVLAAIEGAL